MENLKKDYPWLFKKKITQGQGRNRKVIVKEFTPIIREFDSHYAIQREVNATSLILSKTYTL